MDSISFNSKILLFGEYGIMHDSDALSIPFKKFNGFLSISDLLSEDQKISNRNLESLYEYIIQEDYLNDIINSDNLKEEIGDVYCMIKLMQEWDVVSWEELEERDKVKRAKLSKWSNLISEKV